MVTFHSFGVVLSAPLTGFFDVATELVEDFSGHWLGDAPELKVPVGVMPPQTPWYSYTLIGLWPQAIATILLGAVALWLIGTALRRIAWQRERRPRQRHLRYASPRGRIVSVTETTLSTTRENDQPFQSTGTAALSDG